MRGDTLHLVPVREGGAAVLLSDLGIAVDIADMQAAVVVRSYGMRVDGLLLAVCKALREFEDIYFAPDEHVEDWKLCAEWLVARGVGRWLSHKEGFANKVLAFIRHEDDGGGLTQCDMHEDESR